MGQTSVVLIKNVLTCQKKINIYSLGTVIQRTILVFASFVKFAFPELNSNAIIL